MGELYHPLAGLRAAIVEFANAIADRMVASSRGQVMRPLRERTEVARSDLEAELAAVEVLIVTVTDAVQSYDPDDAVAIIRKALATF